MLCACIALPIPGENTTERSTLDEDASSRLQPGISTREDVLLALGEPGEFARDGSWFTSYPGRQSKCNGSCGVEAHCVRQEARRVAAAALARGVP